MYAVEMKQIVKKFGSFTANDHIDFCVKKGEIHSLLGENGAGKSTLMNILYGLYSADSGEIFLDGKITRIHSPIDAIANGISMVHQHFMLVDSLTVTENIVLGKEPKHGMLFDFEEACRKVQKISDTYHLQVNPREKVENLSVGVKQRVEIIKALFHEADILILDEPTAVLTPQEVDGLFQILRLLKEQGKTIIIITHKLKETIAIADSLTILRKGRLIMTRPVAGADEKELAEQMVGRLVSFDVERKPSIDENTVAFAVEEICLTNGSRQILDHVSFEIKKGEILGVAGVEGNGQTELIEILTGIRIADSGHVKIGGKLLDGLGAADYLKAGVGHVPEDRNLRGGVADFRMWENFILGYHRRTRHEKRGFLKLNDIRQETKKAIKTFEIRCDSEDNMLEELSGGNQQKLIIARVMEHEPLVIIAAQPTRGVDIGAIEYIHHKLMDFRNDGYAVLLISADLDELVKLADRIAVIFEGKITALKPTAEFDESILGNYMLGNISD